MSETTKNVVIIIATATLVLVVIDLVVRRAGRRVMRRLPVANRALTETRYRLLVRIAQVVVVVAALVAVLNEYPATRAAAETLLASSVVLGLVVGLAARAPLANFVAGVMIAISQPVRIGDRVIVGAADGIIEDIGLAYTRIRTPANERVLIPNEQLAASPVTNQSIVDPVSLASATVTVPITADVAHVREILGEQAALAPARIADQTHPGVAVADLTDTAAVFSVGVWVADPARVDATSAWLRERCVARLNDEGLLAQPETEQPA